VALSNLLNRQDYCLWIESRPSCSKCACDVSCFCDLDLDPLTLIYESDLDILNVHPHTKNEVSIDQVFSKVKAATGQTDTHRQTRLNALPVAFTAGNKQLNNISKLVRLTRKLTSVILEVCESSLAGLTKHWPCI